jgi:type IX secretion system PorP/SprF family membrane protein
MGQDPIFSQFFSSPLYLNPAFAGSTGAYRFVLNSRAQPFVGFNTFSTFNFSYDGMVNPLYGGVGLLITSDLQAGLIMKNQVSGIYSYHLRASDGFHIHFGAQAGYTQSDFKWQDLEWAVDGEPVPLVGQVGYANFAAGILFFSETIYGGFAAHNLSEPSEAYYQDSQHRLSRKYTAHFGMHLRPGQGQRPSMGSQPRAFSISPNIILQHQAPFTRINYGVYVGLDPFLAGVWLRQDLDRPYTLIYLLGAELGAFRVGYSYDHSLSGFSGATHGIHEISVIFSTHSESKKGKYRILNCPSF